MNTIYRLKRSLWFSILILGMLILTGCAQATVSPSTGDVTPAVPVTGENRVEVQLDEFTITMPVSITAGQTSFEVTNIGTEEHSFKIAGQGVEAELDHHLQPGESMTLDVNLTPGIYEVICPVDDHAGEGMRLELTVNAP